MPPKKSGKAKQADKKAADKKDEKKSKETTLPTVVEEPAPTPPPEPPAEPEPELQPIPVPEPTPLPVPAPTSRQPEYSDGVQGFNHEYADHHLEQPTEHDGWDYDSGHPTGGWETKTQSGWDDGGSKARWDEGSDYASDLHDDYDNYEEIDHRNSKLGPTETTHDQLLGQPPPIPPPASHDKSSGAQPSKSALPQAQVQNPPPPASKTYILASDMANRHRSVPPPPPPATNPAPQPSRPSYYWDPNQPPPPKQSTSTTKGQHNPVLSKLTPWGEPKNVDPWGDPKPQPKPAPAPPKPIATKERKAWHDWGRQPQPAGIVHPPIKQQPVGVNYSYDYDSEGDEEYTDDETFTGNDAWGRPSGSQHGWGPDPRRQSKVNHVPRGSEYGQDAGAQPVLSSAEHAQILNAMLNNVPQDQPGHHGRHPHRSSHPSSAYEIERAKRLQQRAEEKRRMEEMMYHQQQQMHQHHQRGGKRSKKQQKSTEWDDEGWAAPKDEWAAGGWENAGGHGGGDGDGGHGWGQGDDDGRWEQESRNQKGNSRGKGGGDNSWGHTANENSWDNGRDDSWGNGGNNIWDHRGNNSWGNEDDGWDHQDHDGGHHGWGNGEDDWDGNGGDSGWDDSGGKEHKRRGDGRDNQDNSQSNNKYSANGWGESDGRGDGDDGWEEADDGWGESSRYHVVDDPTAQKSSKTLMHAMGASNLKQSKPSKASSTTASKLGLPPGVINESENQAFGPAMRAIFGRERMARDRIYWSYSPENEPQVISVMSWIQQMEDHLAFFGLLKFLEAKERGALFVNVTFRLEEYPNLPAFDWLPYGQIQASTDRILQHSILASDPATQTLVFVYLPSRTGNSVAMWRRKLQVPKDVRQTHLQAITKVKSGLRPDKEYRIHVDELPPADTGKQSKSKLSKSITKQTQKTSTASAPKPAKSALKTHHRGQSLPVVPKKKRKWWQILRFAD
ncbi:hypothetical protein H0H87_009721 [Tephrocybe sp. NHM501043]|nr:hypothetical protein H0H87_009721 [Tephrocybe sp. NHM501043]